MIDLMKIAVGLWLVSKVFFFVLPFSVPAVLIECHIAHQKIEGSLA